MKQAFVYRVWEAVLALDAPSSHQSSIYSTARQRIAFLDGGYVSVSGYGFGSHSYSVILGERALQFICYRIGVLPPRYRAEAEMSRYKTDLEEEFCQQRMVKADELSSSLRAASKVHSPSVNHGEPSA